MSPTLLEGTMSLLLIGVGWWLGIELLPSIRRLWQQSQARLDQLEEQKPQPAESSRPIAKDQSDE